MALFDDMQDQFGGNMDKMRETYEELKNRESEGSLSDEDRGMLDRLRPHFEK